MGNHLIRPAAPEFNGDSFTHTWIWGLQGGHISFWEPMITVAFLKKVKAEYDNTGWYDAETYGGREITVGTARGIQVPITGIRTADGNLIAQEKAGLYPRLYRILYDQVEGTWTVSLVDFRPLCQTRRRKKLACPDSPEVSSFFG